MTIKLVGALPQNLKDVGLKPGMVFSTQDAQSTIKGARLFKWKYGDEYLDIVIYPENYRKT